jgi:mannosyltransferase OCH1-like enzyme
MIPKVIHQIWIGPKPAPKQMMQTWKEKHPGFEYILWNEEEIAREALRLVVKNRLMLWWRSMEKPIFIAGKSSIN